MSVFNFLDGFWAVRSCYDDAQAVGVRYLDTFFNILDYALKPKAAIVVSATSQPEFRFTTLQYVAFTHQEMCSAAHSLFLELMTMHAITSGRTRSALVLPTSSMRLKKR